MAVKVLAAHLSEDDRARKRFQREARTAAGLSSHPHVVTIYDVGEHDGHVLHRDGAAAAAGRWPTSSRAEPRDRAAPWRCAGCARPRSALDAAHDRRIVHRDVKPANMLLDERGRLALADFGIARLGLEDQITQTGQVLGTAAYIAPEQAMGERSTPASDRYALAVVAFELLTGAQALPGRELRRAGPRPRRTTRRRSPRSGIRRCRAPSTTCSTAAWPSRPATATASAGALVDAIEDALTEPVADPTLRRRAHAPPVPVRRTESRAAPPPRLRVPRR